VRKRRTSSGRRSKEAGNFLDIVSAAGRLKNESRRGWVRKLGLNDPESVADHSYRTALIAMVYSDQRKLDTSRVVKMAILHDLPEAIVGDTMPGERSMSQKLRLEAGAMKEILKSLPAKQRGEYWDIWNEYNRGNSSEARLVRQVDKLEMAVQAVEYRKTGAGGETDEFIESALKVVEDEDMLDLLRKTSLKEQVTAARLLRSS